MRLLSICDKKKFQLQSRNQQIKKLKNNKKYDEILYRTWMKWKQVKQYVLMRECLILITVWSFFEITYWGFYLKKSEKFSSWALLGFQQPQHLKISRLAFPTEKVIRTRSSSRNIVLLVPRNKVKSWLFSPFFM